MNQEAVDLGSAPGRNLGAGGEQGTVAEGREVAQSFHPYPDGALHHNTEHC